MVEIFYLPGLPGKGRVNFCASHQMPLLAQIMEASAWDTGDPSSHSSMERNVLL